MEYLSVAEVLLLHARLIQRTGGSNGILQMGLLESAVARPRAAFAGNDLYPDLWSKAAALMDSLIRNHPFVDGNKRTALAAAGIFLELNGYSPTATTDQALAFVRQVYSRKMTSKEMATWLEDHSQPVGKRRV